MEPKILAEKLIELEKCDRDYNEALLMAEGYRKRREDLRRELLSEVPGLKYLQAPTGKGKPPRGTTEAKARAVRILQSPDIRAKANATVNAKYEKRRQDVFAVLERLGGRSTVRQIAQATGMDDTAVLNSLYQLMKESKVFRIPNKGAKNGKPFTFLTPAHLHALPKVDQDAARHEVHLKATEARHA